MHTVLTDKKLEQELFDANIVSYKTFCADSNKLKEAFNKKQKALEAAYLAQCARRTTKYVKLDKELAKK